MGDVEYVFRGGLSCPFCRSTRVEAASSVDGEVRRCWQDVQCLDCGKVWRDVYELASYEGLDSDRNATPVAGKPENGPALYLLVVWGDTEPELVGPFTSADERDVRAREIRAKHGREHGVYMLSIPDPEHPSVDAYSGGFFMREQAA